jgi:hypothetical protein
MGALKSARPSVGKLVAVLCSIILLSILYAISLPGQSPTLGLRFFIQTETPTPRFNDAQVAAIASVATYEAQVFPEPLKSQAYAGIAWTMRNRVVDGFGGTVDYTDEQILSRYTSYAEHKNDPPDPRAVEIAREVLGAESNEIDPTHGARHYVDNSYWTGTHEQTGNSVKVRGKFSDIDVKRMIDETRFTLAIEWKSPPDHPRGALVFGLYFFNYWPPPIPLVTPTFTPTPRPTNTITPTATLTRTPTRTPLKIATSTMTATTTLTTTATTTPRQTISPTAEPALVH